MQEPVPPDHLALFVQAVQELSLARDLETVVKIVRTAARRLTGADGASFILLDGDNVIMRMKTPSVRFGRGSGSQKNIV